MRFAFALGVASVAFQEGFSKPPRPFDAIAIASTVILPIGLTVFPDTAGLIQRLMFLIAYAWLANALIGIVRATPNGNRRYRDQSSAEGADA